MKDKVKTRVVHCKVDPYDVYIGRPSRSVTLYVECRSPQPLWAVVEHPNSCIALGTQSAPKLPRGVTVIPAKTCLPLANFAARSQHGLSTLAVRLFVQTGTIIRLYSAPPESRSTSPQMHRAADRANSCPLLCVDLTQSMFEFGSLLTGRENTSTQQTVVTGDAKSPHSQWFTTALDPAVLVYRLCRSRSHDRLYTVSHIHKPFKWGNPYKLWREADRPDMLVAFRKYLRARIAAGDLDPTELKGKTLGCWCAPRLCHGDVLADFAEGRDA